MGVREEIHVYGGKAIMDGYSSCDAIRCKTCGLVQYRTRTEICRRCQRRLPPRDGFVIPFRTPIEDESDGAKPPSKLTNLDMVEKIGRRIQHLRTARGLTQGQLQKRSNVSRSYLSRIESSQMTPSLGTVEKLSKALGIGLNRFFIPDSSCETLLDDAFIQGLRPYLRQLDFDQWESVLVRLAAISGHVLTRYDRARPATSPRPVRIGTFTERVQRNAVGHP
jgi:transcriptional regulator with XRE-family HTH domain